jgi:hypothetical protein
MRPFVRIGNHTVIHQDEINWIDVRKLGDLVVVVHYLKEESCIVTGVHAIELMMAISPSIFEGKRLKWKKHRWMLHNLIGHPLMQFLVLLKKYDLAMLVHDLTIPRPDGKYSKTGTKA